MEVWKDIKGFEGLYKVSNLGRVKSFINIKEGFILKNSIGGCGYARVNLFKKEKPHQQRVHVIVSKAFLDENYTQKGFFCNHIDGNKQNNKLDNLEIVTRSENELHAFRIGLKSHKGDNHNRRKLSSADVKKIRESINKGVKNTNIS
jgi:hypothetical protein